MSPRKPMFEELTREMIMEAAHQQFMEKPYHQVSMRSIAKTLGCSHGAIYYHFKNKAELFYAIVASYFERLNTMIEDIVHGPENSSIKLRKLFLSFLEFGLNNQSQYEFMFMMRSQDVDGLSQEAANLSYQKYAHSVQVLSEKQVSIQDIYAAFLALHGFVSFYIGVVSGFEEVKMVAQNHVQFILKSVT